MKKLLPIIITVIMTFTITENYMLSSMEVTGTPGEYVVSVFGVDFKYE